MAKKITLKKAHEHAGVVRPAGSEITVDNATAEWLSKYAADVVGNVKDVPDTVKPAAPQADTANKE